MEPFYNTSTPANYVETEAPPVDPTVATASQSASGANVYHTWWGSAIDYATFGLWNPDAASTGGYSAGSSSQSGGGIFGSLGGAVAAPIDAAGKAATDAIGAAGSAGTSVLKAAVPETIVIVLGVAIVAFAAVYITFKVKS